jgi:hypothetical protein
MSLPKWYVVVANTRYSGYRCVVGDIDGALVGCVGVFVGCDVVGDLVPKIGLWVGRVVVGAALGLVDGIPVVGARDVGNLVGDAVVGSPLYMQITPYVVYFESYGHIT